MHSRVGRACVCERGGEKKREKKRETEREKERYRCERDRRVCCGLRGMRPHREDQPGFRFSRNMKRFRGGLAFKVHRRVYHSTVGSKVKKKEKGFRVYGYSLSSEDGTQKTVTARFWQWLSA